MKTDKIIMTPSQEKWLVRHFKHTKNDAIMERFGWSHSTLHRFARKLGLKKSTQFMHKCQRETTRKAKESHLRNGTYPPKGYRIPRSEEFGFKKGETNLQRIGKRRERKRIEKSAESRRQTIKEERARVTFGLPQRTKLHLIRRPKYVTSQRYYLRKLGYLVERGSFTVYYTPETRRSPAFEARTLGNCTNYVHFDFKPYETS